MTYKLTRWTKNGKDRLYVRVEAGPQLGYYDLITGFINCKNDADRLTIGAEAKKWLTANNFSETNGAVHGVAGASAQREFEKRVLAHQRKVEEKQKQIVDTWGEGFVGKVALFLDNTPKENPRNKSWAKGAQGEREVGAKLEELTQIGCVVLHDRQIPGSKANIDHILISPWGVWNVDAKLYKGKRPNLRTEGGLFTKKTEHLYLDNFQKDKLVATLQWETSKITDALARHELQAVPVNSMLCFVAADWPLVGGSFVVNGVHVCWPKLLAKKIAKKEAGLIDPQEVATLLRSVFSEA